MSSIHGASTTPSDFRTPVPPTLTPFPPTVTPLPSDIRAQLGHHSTRERRIEHPPLHVPPWGFFESDTHEFVLIRPDTPQPWVNRITNGTISAIARHSGGGQVFFNHRETTYPLLAVDQDAESTEGQGWWCVLRHRASGYAWSPMLRPAVGALTRFEARHGLNMTTWIGSAGPWTARIQALPHPHRAALVWTLSVETTEPQPAEFDVWWGVEPAEQRDHAWQAWLDNDTLGLFAFARPTKPNVVAPCLVFAANGTLMGWDTRFDQTMGPNGHMGHPAFLAEGRLGMQPSSGTRLCLTYHAELRAPGGGIPSGKLELLLGAVPMSGTWMEDARAILAETRQFGIVDQWIESTVRGVSERLAKCQVELPTRTDAQLPSAMLGSGWMASVPRLEAPSILELATNSWLPWHIEAQGGWLRWAPSLDPDKPFAPQADAAVLTLIALERALWEDADNERPPVDESWHKLVGVLDAMLKSLNADGLVPHASWEGEADLVAGYQAAWLLRRAQAMDETRLGADRLASWIEGRERLAMASRRVGWNGQWWRSRHTPSLGDQWGPYEDQSVELRAQLWAMHAELVAGTGDGFVSPRTMLDRLQQWFYSPHGPKNRLPALPSWPQAGIVGAWSPPGLGDNGAVDPSLVGLWAWLEARHGLADRALALLNIVLSVAPDDIQRARHAPYSIPREISGPDHAAPGTGIGSWNAAAAAWLWLAMTRGLLGMIPEAKGLRLEPHLPTVWKTLCVRRRFRGATYQVYVDNQQGRNQGVRSMTVDGKRVGGQVVPPAGDSAAHIVQVLL